MTANVLEHRRAKAFAEALEAHRPESRPGEASQSGSTAMAELLTMADALGALPEPELSMEVRTVQRAQLMAAFEQAWAGGPAARVPQQRKHRAAGAASRSRWGRRFAIGGLVAGVAVGSFAGAAAASSNALPGDALYGMKRGLEGLQLDWAGSDSERGALLLDQASNRLEEAQSLLGRPGATDALSAGTVEQVRQALDDMHAEAIRGRDLLRSVYRSNGSLAPMRKLAGFADGEDQRWAQLHSKLPSQLTTQASKVDELFSDISEDVAPLHLEQQPGKGGSTGHGGASGGQQAPGSTNSPAAGDKQGSADSPNSRGNSSGGTGQGGSTPSTATGGVGSLVNGLTNGLTGGGSANTPPAGQGDKSAPSAAPSTPTDGQGLTIPPLLPGLLPEITLG